MKMDWSDLPHIFSPDHVFFRARLEHERPNDFPRTMYVVHGVNVWIEGRRTRYTVTLDQVTNIQVLLDRCVGTIEIKLPGLWFTLGSYRDYPGNGLRRLWYLEIDDPESLAEFAELHVRLPEMSIRKLYNDNRVGNYTGDRRNEYLRFLYENYIVPARRIAPKLIYGEPFSWFKDELQQITEREMAVRVLGTQRKLANQTQFIKPYV